MHFILDIQYYHTQVFLERREKCKRDIHLEKCTQDAKCVIILEYVVCSNLQVLIKSTFKCANNANKKKKNREKKQTFTTKS